MGMIAFLQLVKHLAVHAIVIVLLSVVVVVARQNVMMHCAQLHIPSVCPHGTWGVVQQKLCLAWAAR